MSKSIILYLVAVTLFTLVLFQPFTMHLRDAVANAIDPLFYAWNLSHNADNWFKGFDALVNTNIFYPLTNTIAYSDTLWGQSIFVNPIIWITHNPILAENIAIFISFPLSALSMFLLSMYVTGNKTASFAAGIFYAFSYPRLSQIGHLPAISSQWLPLYLLYLFKFLDEGKKRNFILLCLWYLLSLASSIYFGVFLIPITAVVLLVDIVKRIKHNTFIEYKSRILATVPFLIPFIIIIGICVFPYIRLKVENPEIKRNIDDLTHLRASLIDYASVLPTSLNAYKLHPTNSNEHVLFPTFTLLLLALLGLVTSHKRTKYTMKLFALIGFISFILSLGNEQRFTIGSYLTNSLKMPYYYLYKLFPIFQIVRVPARFGIFVILSLSVLAACSIDSIMKKNKLKWITGIFICTFIFEIWQINTPFVTIPLEQSIPKVYTWIREQPEPMIIAEIPVSLTFYHGNSMEDQLYRSYAMLRELDIYALETYRIYFSSFHKKRMMNGYSGFLPESYNKLVDALGEFPSEISIKALQDIGVTHAVVHLRQYEKEKRNEIIKALASSSLLTLAYWQDDDFVYTIHKRK